MSAPLVTIEPAHNLDAEAALLGAFLAGAPIPELHATDFYRQEHQLIFAACRALADVGDPIDPVTVKHRLYESGKLVAAGGGSGVASLLDALPDVANVEHYAGIVRKMAAKRQLAHVGARLVRGEDAEGILAELLPLVDGARGSGADAVWHTLREYLNRPDLLQPPEVVVSGLAWRGRVTLLAAREKAGKSTYAAFGAALLSQAHAGGVLWVNLEEAPFDVVHRFVGLNADPDRVMVSENLPNKLTDLEAAITKHTPDLVVIDTLAAWGSGRVTDWNSAAQVTPIMLELVDLARRHNLALVILHHGKKVDGSYRDSTAIGASVDVLIEMTPDGDDDTVRHFKPKGRWNVEPFSLRFTGTSFEPVVGGLSIHDRVYQFVKIHPGCSKREIRDNVQGKNSTKDEAIEHLIRDGRVEKHGGAGGSQYHASIDVIAASEAYPDPPETPINGARRGHGRGTAPCATEKPNGALTGHGRGTARGTPPVPHPLTGGGGGTVERAHRESVCLPGAISDGGDPATVTAGDGPDEPDETRPELHEFSRNWPKHLQKRLRELVGQGYGRLHATELVRQEYAEGTHG